MENISLLGATGSVGSSVLDVIRANPGKFQLAGISGFKNLERLAKIINEFSPLYVCLVEENQDFAEQFPGIYFLQGVAGINRLASLTEADTVIIAISGMAGLAPTISAIKSDKKILSANKESIVAAGDIINKLLVEHKNIIIPLDSEHNAIFNQLIKIPKKHVDNIVLTASGGPFRDKPIDKNITIEDVLDHPTWDMGQYITVNSATMINKGFEVIEAHHLFNMDYDRIRVLIHKQSLVHGIVETIDGSQYFSVSPSDMRYPISLAMFYPEIPAAKFDILHLDGKTLDFAIPDLERFPLLKLSYEIGRAGGIMPAVLNAANEIVVEKFLSGQLPFYQIPAVIRHIIDKFENKHKPELEEILIADKQARIYALELMMK